MKFVVVAVLAGMTLVPSASAQKLELKFDALAAKASDKAEVDLDGALLKLALQHSGIDLFGGVQAIHVRHYAFDHDGSWSEKDLEPLRKQVSEASGWSRVLTVKEHDENIEVFMLSRGDKVNSCLIVAAEARELSVVYLKGTLTLAQVKHLVDSDSLDSLTDLAK